MNITKFIIIMLFIIISSETFGASLSGKFQCPESLDWYLGNVVLQGIDTDFEEGFPISPGAFNYTFTNVTAGKYFLFCTVFSEKGLLNVYYPHLIDGNCSGLLSDTLTVSGMMTGIDIICPDYGSLNVQIQGLTDTSVMVLPLLKQTGDSCAYYQIPPNMQDESIRSKPYLEPGEYFLDIFLMKQVHIDTIRYNNPILIEAGKETYLSLNINDLMPPLSFEKSPEVSQIGKKSAHISWEMKEACVCSLLYSDFWQWDSVYWEGNSSQPQKIYEADLTNLLPERFYLFQVKVYDDEDSLANQFTGFFRTLPPDYYIVQGPSVPFVKDTSAIIEWTVNQSCICSLFYTDNIDTDMNIDWTPFSGNSSVPDTYFKAELTGLKNFTPYFYYIKMYSSPDSLENETNRYNHFMTLWKYVDKNFQILGKPEILSLSDHSAVISIKTDEFVHAICNYYKNSTEENQPLRSLFYPIPFNWHLFILDSLEPAVNYHYQVGTYLESGEPYYLDQIFQFRTLENADTIPPILLSGPHVIPEQNKAVVSFTADEAVIGNLSIFQNNSLVKEFEITDFRRHHQILVSPLEQNSEYSIQLTLNDYSGNQYFWDGQENLLSKIQFMHVSSSGNQFTTNSQMDTTAPVFAEMPYLIDHYDSSAVIRFSSNEPCRYQLKLFDNADRLALWTESDLFENEHTVFCSRLLPGVSYSASLSISDLTGNTDSLNNALEFTTRRENNIIRSQKTSDVFSVQYEQYTLFYWENDLPGYAASFLSTTSSLDNSIIYEGNDYDSKHLIIANYLNKGNQYYYQLKSKDLFNRILWESSTESFRFESPTSPALYFEMNPAAVYQNSSEAVLFWKTNTLSSYTCEYWENENPLNSNTVSSANLLREHRALLSGLSPSTYYSCNIEAVTIDGKTVSSEFQFLTENSEYQDTIPPNPPGSIAVSLDSLENIVVSWTPSSSQDIKGYEIIKNLSGSQILLSSNYPYLKYIDKFEANFITYSVAAIDLSDNKSEYVHSQEVSIDEKLYSKLKELTILPNYPNPFRDYTYIRFYQTKCDNAVIRIYNVIGEKLIEEHIQALKPGLQNYKLNSAKWTSGIYLYSIKTESGEMKTGKMLIIK